MSSTSLYTLVAGASLLLALWQPADADIRFTDTPPARAQSMAEPSLSRHIEDGAGRHDDGWEPRKVQRTQSAGAGS